MPRKKRLEVYNFTLTFGDKVLLDMLSEIVLPAFFNNRVREYRGVRYLLLDTQIVFLGENEDVPAISGRFVKDTQLRREQVLDNEDSGLIQNEASMRSSPSCLFVLVLSTHRLLYLKETSYPPDIKSFRAAIEYFLNRTHLELLGQLYDSGEYESYTSLEAEYPYPRLRITPIASPTAFREKFRQYNKLQSIEVRLTNTNQIEYEEDLFWQDARAWQINTGSSKAVIRGENKEEGLNIEAVSSSIENAVLQADARFKSRGVDEQNNTFVVTNDNVKVTASILEVLENIPDAAKQIYDTCHELIANNIIPSARIVGGIEAMNRRARQIILSAQRNDGDDSANTE